MAAAGCWGGSWTYATAPPPPQLQMDPIWASITRIGGGRGPLRLDVSMRVLYQNQVQPLPLLDIDLYTSFRTRPFPTCSGFPWPTPRWTAPGCSTLD